MSGPEYPGHPDPSQPPMGPVTTQFARIDPGPSQTFGAIGALVAVLGAVLVVVAFNAVDWFPRAIGGLGSHFSAVRLLVDHGSSVAEPAKLYFDWLGWALFAVAIVTALIAAVPTLGSAFRGIAPIVAVLAVLMTFLAIRLAGHGPGYSYYLKHARLGFYLALAGFLLMGVGGVIGPRRKHR